MPLPDPLGPTFYRTLTAANAALETLRQGKEDVDRSVAMSRRLIAETRDVLAKGDETTVTMPPLSDELP